MLILEQCLRANIFQSKAMSLIWKSLPTAAVWINWDTIVLLKWVLNAAAKRTSCSVPGPGGQASLQASGRLTCRTSMTESHTPEGGKKMFKLKQVTHRERNIHNHSYLSVSRLECDKQNDIRHQTKQKKDKKFPKNASLQSYGRSKNISIQVSRKCFLQHKLCVVYKCIIIIYKLHVMSVSCESGLGKNSYVTGKQQVESALASRAKAKRDLSYIIQNVMTK